MYAGEAHKKCTCCTEFIPENVKQGDKAEQQSEKEKYADPESDSPLFQLFEKRWHDSLFAVD